MRRWFVGLGLVWGVAAVSGQAQQALPAQAQQVLPVQALPAQAVPIQVQVQIAPAQIQVAQPAIGRANLMVAPGFGGNRFAPTDAIVVGRVIAFEPMDVEATPTANQPKANYRIAIVQVTEAIHGIKKDTQTVRVGFIANGGPNGGVGGGGFGGAGGIQILPAVQPGAIAGLRRPFNGGTVQLQMGQDGIFMLNKHHKENFYTLPNFTSFVNRQGNANFDSEVKTAKQLGKVLADTTAALKSDDASERVLAAAVLINKYRTNTTGAAVKQVPIDAEESKLILKALGQGDWTVGRFNGLTPNAFEMFNQLGVSQKDGYQPMNVRNQQDIVKAMQTWLTANTDKYVIQKFVADPNAKPGVGSTPGGVQPGVRPGVRPLPPIKARPAIQGKAQVLPVVPQAVPAAPPQIDSVPAPQAVPAPLRRE